MTMTDLTPTALIAIVEDDGGVRSALQFSLECEGYAVRAFESSSAALACDDLGEADCLVIDCGLPGMDGLDLMRALRRRSVDCPAILITGAITRRCQAEADAFGAPVLEKPLLGRALTREIEAALSLSRPH